MKTLFLFLFTLCAFSTYSQNTSIADSLKKTGNTMSALNEFLKIIHQDSTQQNIHIEIARCHSLSGYSQVAFNHLEKGVINDTINEWMIEPDFINICELPKWDSLLNLQIKKMNKEQKIKNPALAKQLWLMAIKDQAYYYHINVVLDNNLGQSTLLEHFWQLKSKLNDQNLKDLQFLMDENGWPKISEVDSLAASTAFYIIQHSDYEIQKKYLPVLELAVKNNEATKKELAYLTDRILVHEEKPQLYGTQLTRNLKTGEVKMSPVLDPENLNQRRKEMGMKPLENWKQTIKE